MSGTKKIRCTIVSAPPEHATSDAHLQIDAFLTTLLPEQFREVATGRPIVLCELPPSPSTITVHCLQEATPAALQNTGPTFAPWLPDHVRIASMSLRRYLISINTLPDRTFLYIESVFLLSPAVDPESLRQHLPVFQDGITLCASYPSLFSKLERLPFTTKRNIVKELMRHKEVSPHELFDEYQRLLLATTTEFQELRSSEHLLKLVRTHAWFRHRHGLQTQKKEHGKSLFFRLFHSVLHFPFGKKEVLSLVASLRFLSSDEQFDARHILLACQRCLPTLELVPSSFYSYRYAEEPTISLYIELEKKDGSLPTPAERIMLKRELGRELTASIERMMSRIDIPQNEDDLLRNMLLLSQQIKRTKDRPQVIIQFQGQTDQALDFHVTVVRVSKQDDRTLPRPTPSSEILRFVPLSSSLIEPMRAEYSKQGLVYLVQCAKSPFLRRDRSVDFLKARESVVRCIQSAFGKVRDLNGGLIYQHHKLLETIRPLLTPQEQKEIPIIENLFHSITPSIIKNLLGPEHMLTVFRQYLSLRADLAKQPLIEEYENELFIGFIRPESLPREEILQTHLQIAEEETALCYAPVEDKEACFIICCKKNQSVRAKLISRVTELLNEKQRALLTRSLRISLTRPTRLLDPRIGTDRTSGTVIKMLYEGLLRLDLTGTPTLAIAEEIILSDDGKTYTFKLRPTFWSNGQPLRAHDFEYAWKKVLEPSFQTLFDYLFHPIKNAKLVKSGRLPMEALGVRTISDYILEIQLEHPAPHFLELCCLWIYSPLCKDIDQTHPGWAYYGDRTYVCNGPFKLAKWSRKSGLQVVKNELYWDKDRVGLERIDISIIEDPLHALTLFEKGELDWIGEPLSETPLCLLKQNHPCMRSSPMSAVQWCFCNVQNPPFRSSKVRRAFSYAIDRSAVIKACLQGDERPSHSILPASLSLIENQTALPFDLAYAQKLFKEGMEEQGLLDSIPRPIKFIVYDQEPHKSVAHFVAKEWERAFGILINLEVRSWHDFFAQLGKKDHDILCLVWYSWFKDPLYTFNILKSHANQMNASKWSNEAFVHLVELGEAAQDKEQRTMALREAEKLVMKEMPIIPLFDYSSRFMKNDAVENIYVSHVGHVDFKWTTFKKEYRPMPHPITAPQKNPREAEVRLYLQTDVNSLDPRIGGDRRSQIISREIYERLTAIGDSGKPSLALAESVEISDDGREYTFHLRPSKWSNGADCTAHDFEWTWKSVLSPSFLSIYPYAFFSIKNAKAARLGLCTLDEVGVQALDRRTLRVTLENKTPSFLELIANPVFSPVYTENDRTDQYVSNGPYHIKEHRSCSHIVLEKNEFYWNHHPETASRFVFSIVDDPNTAYSLFQSGALDWIGAPFGTIPPEKVVELERKHLLQKQETGAVFWLTCRTTVRHLSSAYIRRAIAHAINRDEICNSILRDGERPAYSFLPDHMSLSETKPFYFAPTLAKTYFEQGLLELGLTKSEYPPIIINLWNDQGIRKVVSCIAQQLQKHLGIRVEIALQDWSTYFHKYSSGEFQLAATTWYSWLHDPSYNLAYLRHNEIAINSTEWYSPGYIHALDAAISAPSAIQRHQYLRNAEDIVLQELPIIPIYYPVYMYAKASNLTGESLSSIGILELKNLKHTEREVIQP